MEKCRNKGRTKKYYNIYNTTYTDIKEKNCAKIDIVCIFFLNQCIPETAIGKLVCNSSKNGRHGNKAILLWP